AIDEGDALALDASASTAGPTATYAWDLDGDGQFDDATGATPTVAAADLAALGLDDGPAGPATVSVRVTEGPSSDTADATVTVANVAPTAAISGVPGTIVAGSPATVTFSATDPGAADTTAGFDFAIDWGDGTPQQPVSGTSPQDVDHTYAAAGTFTISATASDKDGDEGPAATATATVVPLVVADAGGSYAIDEGSDLALDASGSTAGPTATYAWDLDGNGQFDDATGATPTVAAADLAALGLDDGPAGPVSVSVRVTEGPSSDTADATVTVANVAPTAGVTLPATIAAGAPATVTFDATDPGAADTAAGFDFAVDWGDGSAIEALSGTSPRDVDHTYATTGTFTVSVTATDKDGDTGAAATATATVVPLVVADAGGPYAIAEGDDLALDASGSTAGPTAVYTWDLDDDGEFDDATGVTPTLTPDELDPLGLADGPAGPRTLAVRVTEGPSSDTATATFSITNVAPAATVGLPAGGIVAGTPATVKFGADDPSPTDMAADFVYRIDWEGDGTVDDVVTGPSDPPETHTYASAGDVGLTVVAVDKDGAASAPTVTTVAVTPAQPGGGGTGGTGGAGGGGGGGGTGGGGALPFTGSDIARTLLAAAALLAAGTTLVTTTRRRRRRSA
ncbi:MAG TPA: PKD domain-containing protein, partial [Acidimicrobiales bacterium]|nr:PKD domain-containing protein [Acidimicrobiales bacterium]